MEIVEQISQPMEDMETNRILFSKQTFRKRAGRLASMFSMACIALLTGVATTWAQSAQDPAQGHEHHMQMGSTGWTFMQDAVVYGLFNYQGGTRGGTDAFIAPNWWMGMT